MMETGEEFVIRLEKVAGLFFELLQESKDKMLTTPLSTISFICDIAQFMQAEKQFCLYSLNTQEQSTQTRLAFSDIEILNTKVARLKCNNKTVDRVKVKNHTGDIVKTVTSKTSSEKQSNTKSQINPSRNSKSTTSSREPLQDKNNGGNFQCSYCFKTFVEAKGLRAHLWVHERKKDFECEICKKTFLRSHQLVRHKRTHSGEQPYKCTMCFQKFNDVSNMKAHMKKQHSSDLDFENAKLQTDGSANNSRKEAIQLQVISHRTKESLLGNFTEAEIRDEGDKSTENTLKCKVSQENCISD